MIWLTKPIAEFDAEKRRRWYAATLGAAGATSLMTIFLWKEGFTTPDTNWVLEALIVFTMWLCIFLLKYASSYALWYKPYHSRTGAIGFSVIAIFAVYFGIFGCLILFGLFKGQQLSSEVFRIFYIFNKYIFGLPYIAAAIVGWCFARPAPDARDQF